MCGGKTAEFSPSLGAFFLLLAKILDANRGAERSYTPLLRRRWWIKCTGLSTGVENLAFREFKGEKVFCLRTCPRF